MKDRKLVFWFAALILALVGCTSTVDDASEPRVSTTQVQALDSPVVVWADFDGGVGNVASNRGESQAFTDPGLRGTVNFGSRDGTGGSTNPSGGVYADYAVVPGGDGNFAWAPYSFAGGNRSEAGSTRTHPPDGLYAFAYGHRCFADRIAGWCFGSANVSLGEYAGVFGQISWARGPHSLAGGFASATGISGEDPPTSGKGAVAVGFNVYALKDGAVANGWQTEARKKGSAVSGIGSIADGEGADARNASKALGDYSTTAGFGKATRWGEYAHGSYSANEGGAFHRLSAQGWSFNGGLQDLRLQGDAPYLILDADKAYLITLRFVARSPTGVAFEEHKIAASTNASTLTIHKDEVSWTQNSNGWVFILYVGAGRQLGMQCRGAPGVDVRCAASVDWIALD